MSQLPHFRVTVSPAIEGYTYPQRVVMAGTFARPPREPSTHAANLTRQLELVASQAQAAAPDATEIPGLTLEFQGDPGFKLWLDSLEDRRQGIELLNARTINNTPYATVHVPQGKLGHFLNLVNEYATRPTAHGRAHDKVVESITEIRRATVRSFWTDVPGLFPTDDRQVWWEVWLRTPRDAHGDLTVQQFRMLATESGLRIAAFDVVRFAERAVILAWGPTAAWTRQPDLLDLVAELRQAKELPTDYLTLPPRWQRDFANELLQRLTAPATAAPAVCILDTGVQQGHPLLSIALDGADVLSVNAAWGTTDHAGHGTEMAGLALYGCLTQVLTTNGPIALAHRLESVKLLPPTGSNDPQNYGALTQQAAYRAEIQSPHRPRVFCLAVTADGRDEGLPTSWSAAIDQLSSGELDDVRRLVIASAGNCRNLRDNGYIYPDSNHTVAGIQDPAQSWNALTVGAVTNRVVVQSNEWRGWQAIATAPGALSPASTTSLPWQDTAWPLKPDVVFEGGKLGAGCGRANRLLR